jgi:PilZ domain
MEQRQAVRIPVQLRARLLGDEALSGWGRGHRRLATDTGIECSCSSRGAPHHHAASKPSVELSIDGLVEDLSRHGMFLRTAETLPPGTPATVCLELPEMQVTLRAQVVRVGCGERVGLGVQFAGAEPDRRQLVNYLMRCHAHGA